MVLNSRPTRENSQIWRRRKCQHCGEVFTTHEAVDLSGLLVLKKSGKTEVFSQAKLYTGIYRATIGNTPNRGKLVDQVTTQTEREILFLKSKKVTSAQIADIVIKKLRKADTGACLRFIAYCKDITTEGQAKRELAKYLGQFPKAARQTA